MLLQKSREIKRIFLLLLPSLLKSSLMWKLQRNKQRNSIISLNFSAQFFMMYAIFFCGIVEWWYLKVVYIRTLDFLLGVFLTFSLSRHAIHDTMMWNSAFIAQSEAINVEKCHNDEIKISRYDYNADGLEIKIKIEYLKFFLASEVFSSLLSPFLFLSIMS